MECIRTLVIDPHGQDQFVAALAAHGCDVTTVDSAAEARRVLSTREFDCLVGDAAVVGDESHELATAVGKLAPELPCFIYTTSADATLSGTAVDFDVFDVDEVFRVNGTQSVDRLVAEVVQTGREDTDRILTRVERLLYESGQILVEATDRRLIEHRLCAAFTDQPGYIAAWIGSTETAGQRLELSATSGLGDGVPTGCPIAASPLAVRRAIETDQIAHCTADPEVDGLLDPGTVGVSRLIVVPLTYRQRRYGLLGVYPSSPEVGTRQEQQILDSLGTVIATGLHAVETARLLTTDQVITLQIEIRDTEFRLSQIADQVDAPVEYVGTTQSGTHRELYLTTTGRLDDHEHLTSLPFVEAARMLFTRNGESTISITTTGPTVYDELTEYGGVVVEIAAESDRALLTVDVPPEHDVRSLLDMLRSRYGEVELRGRTERERHDRRHNEFTATVDNRLTDRQRTALEAAHHNGYFDWPRPIDGSEIAQTMGITRQTFHQHLRAAERKLVAAYVDS